MNDPYGFIAAGILVGVLLVVMVDLFNTFSAWFRDKSRSGGLLVAGLLLLAIVILLNPVKWGLMLWGLAKVAIGGYCGYWISRVVTRDRLHRAKTEAEAASIRLSRSIFTAAGILGMALGIR